MNYRQLIEHLSALNESALQQTAYTVNFHLTLRNWLIGRYIFEYEQNGEDRAKYGDRLLKNLSLDLKEKIGRGFGKRNLEHMRLLFRIYSIAQIVSAKSLPIAQTVSAQFTSSFQLITCENLFELSVQSFFSDTRDEQVVYFMNLCRNLTWSHFVELIRIDNDLERQFYEVEVLQGKWSVREMKRQIDSQLFARVCRSKDKDKVLQIAREGVVIEKPQDLIKDPVVLEFLNLPEDRSFTESDLETAIIDNLQNFLLEMGKGFCFVARQKRITFNTRHYYIDLLLYNRKLKSLVVVELKVRDFDYPDAGQMNFYLNYLREEETEVGENPPLGIILCTGKDEAFVEFALGGIDNNVFVSKYQLYLPTKDQLRELVENTKRNVGILSPSPSPLEKLVKELGLSKRVITCLHTESIHTLGDLVAMTELDLLKIRNFGKVSLKQVKDRLAKLNLSLTKSKKQSKEKRKTKKVNQ